MTSMASSFCRTLRRRQSGFVLAGVIVCLLVVMLVSAALIQVLVAHHRQLRVEQQRIQAFWLAESALDRALAQLQVDPDYAGEIWTMEIEQNGELLAGVVLLEASRVAGQSNRRKIHIQAKWPDVPVHRSLVEKDLAIDLPAWGDRE